MVARPAHRYDHENVPESKVYFAYSGGRQVGPMPFAELDDMAARGAVLPTDLVWESGTPEWVPASSLLSFVPKAPPPAVWFP